VVGFSHVILIEAPSSAYPRGMLALGKQGKPPQEEETSGDFTPSSTSFTVASTCTPAPWSLCILNQAGEILVHRHMPAAPDPLLKTIAPYREDVVVWVEWTLHLGLAG
jgi:hypothetical protein